MGLFDFLKPKAKHPLTDASKNPILVNAGTEHELEWLRKQASNLVSVGREKEARELVSNFLKVYCEVLPGPIATRTELKVICYALAYKVLPELAYNHWSEFVDLWTGPVPFRMYLGIKGASQRAQRLSLEQLKGFETQRGELNGNTDCYMVQFPTPSSFREVMNEMLQNKNPSAALHPVLAPHYLAVVVSKDQSKRLVYILGQSMHDSTTLRLVTADGANCNCGPGPMASAQDFFEHLKTLVSTDKWVNGPPILARSYF